jgi:hypothetical protein
VLKKRCQRGRGLVDAVPEAGFAGHEPVAAGAWPVQQRTACISIVLQAPSFPIRFPVWRNMINVCTSISSILYRYDVVL